MNIKFGPHNIYIYIYQLKLNKDLFRTMSNVSDVPLRKNTLTIFFIFLRLCHTCLKESYIHYEHKTPQVIFFQNSIFLLDSEAFSKVTSARNKHYKYLSFVQN